MQQKSTGNLLEELLQTEQLESFLETNDAQLLDTTLAQELQKLLAEKQITKAEAALKSGLSRIYVYQIFSGILKAEQILRLQRDIFPSRIPPERILPFPALFQFFPEHAGKCFRLRKLLAVHPTDLFLPPFFLFSVNT